MQDLEKIQLYELLLSVSIFLDAIDTPHTPFVRKFGKGQDLDEKSATEMLRDSFQSVEHLLPVAEKTIEEVTNHLLDSVELELPEAEK